MPTCFDFDYTRFMTPRIYLDCSGLTRIGLKCDTLTEEEKERKKYTPKKIYYNNPVTVVFWEDNTKTIVRLHEGEEYNEYTAFTAALAKKIFGNNTVVNKIVKTGIVPKKKK